MPMLILGAGRHAKDLLVLLQAEEMDFVFFDNTTKSKSFFGFKLLNTIDLAVDYLRNVDSRYIISVGDPLLRKKLDNIFKNIGVLTSLISSKTTIGTFKVSLKEGLNIMPYVFISNNVKIERCVLINTRVNCHHDVVIGEYSQISPGSILLGGVKVGKYTSIGSGAIILPDVKIGDYATIGAGSVVTKDVPDYAVALGVPCEVIRFSRH